MEEYILYGANNGGTLIFKRSDCAPNANHMVWLDIASGDLDFCHKAEKVYQRGFERGYYRGYDNYSPPKFGG